MVTIEANKKCKALNWKTISQRGENQNKAQPSSHLACWIFPIEMNIEYVCTTPQPLHSSIHHQWLNRNTKKETFTNAYICGKHMETIDHFWLWWSFELLSVLIHWLTVWIFNDPVWTGFCWHYCLHYKACDSRERRKNCPINVWENDRWIVWSVNSVEYCMYTPNTKWKSTCFPFSHFQRMRLKFIWWINYYLLLLNLLILIRETMICVAFLWNNCANCSILFNDLLDTMFLKQNKNKRI